VGNMPVSGSIWQQALITLKKVLDGIQDLD
jgi:hypothetical protein